MKTFLETVLIFLMKMFLETTKKIIVLDNFHVDGPQNPIGLNLKLVHLNNLLLSFYQQQTYTLTQMMLESWVLCVFSHSIFTCTLNATFCYLLLQQKDLCKACIQGSNKTDVPPVTSAEIRLPVNHEQFRSTH